MVVFQRASAFTTEQLHQVMVEAFSDYVIPMSPSLEDFRQTNATRGFDPDLSWVAVEEGRPVGFWFVGKKKAYPNTLYAAATGTVPKARGSGIVSQLFAKLEEHAFRKGYRQIQLEVITSNTAAVKTYKKLGFVTERYFQCFSLKEAVFDHCQLSEHPRQASWDELKSNVKTFWEHPPSWQHSAFAIETFGADARLLKIEKDRNLAAYIAFIPKNGAVMQLAVAPEYRRQGFARALLKEAFEISGSRALSFVNIDENNKSLTQALLKLGATKTLQQFEMHRLLKTRAKHGEERELHSS